MNRLILHVGMPKTGSTSIQSTLFWHSPPEPFRFLTLDTIFGNQLLYIGFRETLSEQNEFFLGGLTKQKLESFREFALKYLSGSLVAAARDKKTPILSAEMIWFLTKVELQSLKDFLNSRGFEVEVFGYIRPPIDYAESVFQQCIKVGSAAEIKHLSSGINTIPTTVEWLDEVFDRRRVHLTVFNPKTFPEKCVVRHFLQTIDIPDDTIPIARENESISLDTIRFLHLWNSTFTDRRFARMTVARRAILIDCLSEIEGPSLRFHPSVTQDIREEFQKRESQLTDRLGSPLPMSLMDRTYRGPDENNAREEVIRTQDDLLDFSPRSLRWLFRTSDRMGNNLALNDCTTDRIVRRLNFLSYSAMPTNLPRHLYRLVRRRLHRHRMIHTLLK